MKNVVKISRLSVICVLCAAGLSSAYGAASVRSLGGVGTYSSASNAAAARSGSAAINSARAGSVRATTGTTAKATNTGNTGNKVRAGSNTARLSVGSYLQGGKTISGGSSIKSQNPGSSSSVTNNNNNNAIIQEQIEQIRVTIDSLQDADGNRYTMDETDDLLDNKQDILVAGDGIDITDGVISAVVVDGKQILLQSDGDYIQWKYDDVSSTWEDLVALDDLVGPEGPQGIQGPKGDPGDAADLTDYSTSTQVIALILQAINTASSNYATAAQGALADTALQPGALTNYSTTTQINQVVEDAIDDALVGVGVNIDGKADKATTLAGYGITDAMTATETTAAITAATTGKVDATDLGDLAYKDAVATTDIVDANVTKAKLATDVQTSLGLADTALQPGDAPDISGAPNDGSDYVLVMNNGTETWMKVAY